MHTRPKKSRDTQKTTPSLYLQPNQSIKSNKGNELDPKCTSKIIWNSCVQPKLSFFAWEALWGKVLTLNCLQKRGCALSNRCFLCQMFEGSIDHLLLHCEKTRDVWMLLLSLFGVSWVFPFSVKETLLGWRGSFVGKKRKVVWQVEPLCLFWAIWKARNKIAFEDSVLSIQRLKASFVYLLWSDTKLWIKGGWSFDLNRFYRLGGFAVREKVFVSLFLGSAVRGSVSL